MFQLFAFYTSRGLESVCEGRLNAESCESYLVTRFNNIDVISFVGESYDVCWDSLDVFTLANH